MELKHLKFNTGRLYSTHGQRIVAVQHADGSITFLDIDRGIAGDLTGIVPFDQKNIMDRYDGKEYRQTSWQHRTYKLRDEMTVLAHSVKSV